MANFKLMTDYIKGGGSESGPVSSVFMFFQVSACFILLIYCFLIAYMYIVHNGALNGGIQCTAVCSGPTSKGLNYIDVLLFFSH